MSTIAPVAVKISPTPGVPGHFDVWPMFGTTVAAVFGWEVTSMQTAGRLSEAVMAGAVFTKTRIRMNHLGQSYMEVETDRVGASTMEADLTRLGY